MHRDQSSRSWDDFRRWPEGTRWASRVECGRLERRECDLIGELLRYFASRRRYMDRPKYLTGGDGEAQDPVGGFS